MTAPRRSPRRQRGAVALEFALVLPLFLLLAVGVGTLGHALVLRYQLSDAAMVASRSLALSGKADSAAASTLVRARLGAAAERCSTLHLNVDSTPLASGGAQASEARVLRVAITCDFKVGAGAALLRAASLSSVHLAASAATPF